MIHVFYPLVLPAYLVGCAAFMVFFLCKKKRLHKTGKTAVLAGFLLQTACIGLEIFASGAFPIRNLKETLFFAAWITAGTYTGLEKRLGMKVLGVIAGPLVFVLTLISAIIPAAAPEPDISYTSIWLAVHVTFIFAGYAALCLGCGTSILYLLQERDIKAKKQRFFFSRLPSLQTIDDTNYILLIIGFCALTIGLVTGFIYADIAWKKMWRWDPKEVSSGITWLIYAALIHERIVAGWRGRRAAIITIIGFVAVLFTFAGVNLFIGGHHYEFTRW